VVDDGKKDTQSLRPEESFCEGDAEIKGGQRLRFKEKRGRLQSTKPSHEEPGERKWRCERLWWEKRRLGSNGAIPVCEKTGEAPSSGAIETLLGGKEVPFGEHVIDEQKAPPSKREGNGRSVLTYELSGERGL